MSFFKLYSPVELLKKVEYEWEQFASTKYNDIQKDYLLINMILTLNHITDWYVKLNKNHPEIIKKFAEALYPYSTIKPANGKKYEPSIKKIIDKACIGHNFETNPDAFSIRDIANDIKHLNDNEKERNNPVRWGTLSYSLDRQYSEEHYFAKIEINGKEVKINLNKAIWKTLSAWKKLLAEESEGKE